MAQFRVEVTVDDPYPKSHTVTVHCSSFHTAFSRAVKSARQKWKGRRFKEMRCKAFKLNDPKPIPANET